MRTMFPDPDAYGTILPRPAIVTLQWSEDRPGLGTRYAHLECAAMRLDPDGTPRNGGYRDPLDSLTATAQWSREDASSSDGTAQPYGWTVAYHDAYHVTFEDAERMLTTLRTVRKSFERIAADAGQPSDFGAYALRFARAIGADRAMFRPDPATAPSWLSQGEWITLDVADIPSWFARRTAQYRESVAA
jgi:hypothetical protein